MTTTRVNTPGTLLPHLAINQLHLLYDRIMHEWMNMNLPEQEKKQLSMLCGATLVIAHHLRKGDYVVADECVAAMPGCFRDMLYNRVGPLLTEALGTRDERRLRLDGHDDLFKADDVLY